MAFAELTIAPRTKGRAAKAVEILPLGELAPETLALLSRERSAAAPPLITRLRERHHALARCLAVGLRDAEASAVTGYDLSRISILKRDPTFRGLVLDYQSGHSASVGEFIERATVLGLTAINNLQERLENDEEPLAASMELEIAKFAADRTGYAPVQKSVNINANVNMGSRLEAARLRLANSLRLEPGEEDIVDP